jgi:hypothetical protein
VNNELDGSVVVNIRPRAGVSCIASLTATLAKLGGLLTRNGRRFSGPSCRINWGVLIVTTFGLSGSDGVDGVEDRRDRVTRGPLVPGTGAGSTCGTMKHSNYLPCLQVETAVVSTGQRVCTVSVRLNRSERHPAESHLTRWAFGV